MPIGINCSVYRNTGTYGSPTWNIADPIRECKLTDERKEFDITTRQESGAEVTEYTTIKYTYDGKIRVPKQGNTDADYEAFRDAYYGNTPIELLILDGPSSTVGSEGVRGYFKVGKWSQSEGEGDALFREFMLTPTISVTAGEIALRRARVGAGPAVTLASINSTTFA